MPSFFTKPFAQKRKRTRQSVTATSQSSTTRKTTVPQDESISGSDDSDADGFFDAEHGTRDEDLDSTDEDNQDDEDEDPSAKRIRLAEQYLANTKREVIDEYGFDAAEIDQENLRRRMGDRLKDDNAESKGKIYRWIGASFAWDCARRSVKRIDGKSVTGVAIHGRSAYTVSKDMAICKWELPNPDENREPGSTSYRAPKIPKRVAYTRGFPQKRADKDYEHHDRPILCIEVSPDGQFVATGGADKKLIIWDANLAPLKVFHHHRDWVTALAFRRGSNQLFSASKDRTVKIWSLDELAYVDTLFGHQDEIVGISALSQEKCVTVGARDRTARLWRVVEESQLVFRGGGAPSLKTSQYHTRDAITATKHPQPLSQPFYEGSIDHVACLDDETFVTAADNGSLSLWNINKKKPVFTYPLAHGLDPPPAVETLSAEMDLKGVRTFCKPSPRWITSLKAIPFSDIVLSGSWDGFVRIWRLSSDKRRIDALGVLGHANDGMMTSTQDHESDRSVATSTTFDNPAERLDGIISDIAIEELGNRTIGSFVVVVTISKEPRLGRWLDIQTARSRLVVFRISKLATRDSIDSSELGRKLELTSTTEAF